MEGLKAKINILKSQRNEIQQKIIILKIKSDINNLYLHYFIEKERININ